MNTHRVLRYLPDGTVKVYSATALPVCRIQVEACRSKYPHHRTEIVEILRVSEPSDLSKPLAESIVLAAFDRARRSQAR